MTSDVVSYGFITNKQRNSSPVFVSCAWKITEQIGVEMDNITKSFDDILKKQNSLAEAVVRFHEEVRKTQNTFIFRESEMVKKEKAIKERERVLFDRQKVLEDNAAKDFNQEKRFEQRKDYLLNLKKDIEKESELQAIGRKQINDDIKKHQYLIHCTLEELREKAKQERDEFIQAVVEEIRGFKLPSAKRIFNTGKVDNLLQGVKQVGEECKKLGQ